MNLRFRLTRSNVEVQTRGEVRYCLPGVGMGVEFVGIRPEAMRAIEKEVKKLTRSRVVVVKTDQTGCEGSFRRSSSAG